MALFRRNKNAAPDMPPEVQDYYQAENRDRSGKAWLLGLGTLLVTMLLVFGLFVGGRFLYRKLRNNDKPAPVAVQTESSEQETAGDSPATSTPPENNPGSTTPNPATPPATTPSPGSNSTAPGTGATGTGTPTPGSATQTPNNTAPGSSDLPTAGPGSNLAIFVAVSVLAYLAHRKFRSEQ